MIGTYSLALVSVSILVAILASYAALDLAERTTAAAGRIRAAWLMGGSVAMGTGIWSMHFIAMLAFRLPTQVYYDVKLVFASAVCAVAASFLGLWVVSNRNPTMWHLALGGLFMGPAIAGMHYIGMAAMRLSSVLSYDPALQTLSIVVAVVVSWLALWLAHYFRNGTRSLLLGKCASAVVMGWGVAGMHYTGMAATSFSPAVSVVALGGHVVLATGELTGAVIASALAVIGLTLLGVAIDRLVQQKDQAITRVAAILETTTDYVGTSDAAGTFLSLNRAGRAMLGIAPDEDISQTTVLSIYPARLHGELMRDQIPRAMRDGSWTGETHFLHRDGHEIPISLVGMVHRSRTGEVDFLSAVARDISVQVQALDAIRESEERFRQLAENVPEVFFIASADMSRVHYVSPAYETIWGQKVAELYDDPRAFLRPVHPDDLSRLLHAIGQVQMGEIATLEIRLIMPDGSIRWVLDRIVPVRDEQGGVYRIVGVARDFTEQIAARQAERRSREEAELATAAKTTFLANMSHEIRTPMSGILGMVELLRDTDLTLDQQRSLDVINSSGEALLTVLNDVLDLSKIEADQLSLESISFDLPNVVDATVRMLAAGAFERGLELVCDVQSDVPRHVRGDPARLRQVLTNLLGNAIKFTHRGEIVLSVQLARRTEEAAALEFTVRDTGIGIPPEKIDSVFEPFHQADASTTREYGGTGLGLSISKRLVRMMGGRISVTSEFKRGSTFRFELVFPIEPSAPAVELGRRHAGLNGVRTLVVDDNPTNRHLLQQMLSQAGAVLSEASDASQALEALRQGRREGNPYRLLVSDVQMPGGDGFELARVVRGDAELADIRIMLLTSAGLRGDGSRCHELGVAAYLHKPVSRVDLLEAAMAVMNESRQAAGSSPLLVTRHSIEDTRRTLRVLVAEDNPVNQQVAASMLRKRGHHVDIANNGREAVAAVRCGAYDAVLMDIQMPELDGFGATREIRRLLEGRALPIIALTANVMTGERERCLAEGMDDYLGKPFKAHELFAAVEGWRIAPSTHESDEAVVALPVDLDGFRSALREGGVEEALDGIIAQFIQDAPGRLAAVEEAVANDDAGAIERAAHAFKSSTGTIRATSLTEALRQTEAAAKSHETENAAELLQRVRSEYVATMSYLEFRTVGG
jgi:two-component system, sensor histidine kinase and response regulator